jgi:hypothetical protein
VSDYESDDIEDLTKSKEVIAEKSYKSKVVTKLEE